MNRLNCNKMGGMHKIPLQSPIPVKIILDISDEERKIKFLTHSHHTNRPTNNMIPNLLLLLLLFSISCCSSIVFIIFCYCYCISVQRVAWSILSVYELFSISLDLETTPNPIAEVCTSFFELLKYKTRRRNNQTKQKKYTNARLFLF